MIMNCSLSNVITDFYKRHPSVSTSTGMFLLGSHVYKYLCKPTNIIEFVYRGTQSVKQATMSKSVSFMFDSSSLCLI